MIHRDLKPSNILVTEGGPIKLFDFGIAKLLNPSMSPVTMPVTPTELRLMTPEYASPEQVRGEVLTTISDVYSLGVVLYELLTGQDGRVEDITPAVVSKCRSNSIDRLKKRLEGDLDNIVMMALRKERFRRYGSPADLQEDLDRFVKELPVKAHRDTKRYHMKKFVVRHESEKALYYLNEALAMRRRLPGKKHSDIVMNIRYIGLVAFDDQDYEKAKSYFHDALAIGREEMGENLLYNSTVHYDLGMVASFQENYRNDSKKPRR